MSEQATPRCDKCEGALACPECDDTRPQAEDIYKGWRIRSPFGRWETVVRVAQANEYAPVLVWTEEAGEVPWRYPRYRRLDARRPEETYGTGGRPELRAVEHSWRDGPMYVVATRDTIRRPEWAEPEYVIVDARPSIDTSGGRWVVQHRPDPEGEPAVERYESKAKARSALRRLGREYAKRMRVRFTIEAAQ